jgi:hypothetical protein
MDEDGSFGLFNRVEPQTNWPFQSTEAGTFDPFGPPKDELGSTFDNPNQFDSSFFDPPAPAKSPPLSFPPDLLPSIAPPAPARTDTGHKKVASASQGPDAFLWYAPQFDASSLFPPPIHARQHSLPEPSTSIPLQSDIEFAQVCADASITFNPARLGFIPGRFWQNKDLTFGQLVHDFFQRKNNANSRFAHKLFNALRITIEDSFYVEFIGVEWITDRVLRIDKKIFGRLLGIKIIDGSLFHQQGNFPSHGFIELSEKNAHEWGPPEILTGVDFDNVRLLVHKDGIITKGCTEADIEECKWISVRKRNEQLPE